MTQVAPSRGANQNIQEGDRPNVFTDHKLPAMLSQIEPANGANQNIGVGTHINVLTREKAARDAGTDRTRHRRTSKD